MKAGRQSSKLNIFFVFLRIFILDRLAVLENAKILDEVERKKRLKKRLDYLEKDNFQEDPFANLVVNKKRPKFEVDDDEDEQKKRKNMSASERKAEIRKKKLRQEHFKQRFRKNFAALLEDEKSNSEVPKEIKQLYDKATAPPSRYPAKRYCQPCGFPSKYNCLRCGGSYCCIQCRDIHFDT
uniref:HIT-type domain-containing protein n=1 Tax=Strongyloides papillosus TaxID=174720 RepID=A0A0N5CFW4_STREA